MDSGLWESGNGSERQASTTPLYSTGKRGEPRGQPRGQAFPSVSYSTSFVRFCPLLMRNGCPVRTVVVCSVSVPSRELSRSMHIEPCCANKGL